MSQIDIFNNRQADLFDPRATATETTPEQRTRTEPASGIQSTVIDITERLARYRAALGAPSPAAEEDA